MAKRRFLRGEKVDVLVGREFRSAIFISMGQHKGTAVVCYDDGVLSIVDVNHLLKIGGVE